MRPTFIRPLLATVVTSALALGLVGLAAAQTPAGAAAKDTAPVTTGSGLIYQSLREGSGPSPSAFDVVKVHYKGTLQGHAARRQRV